MARPSRARSSGSRARVDTSTRWHGVVASAITAAGVSAESPPASNSRNDRGKPADRHVEHDRLPQPGQRRPIDGRKFFVAAGVAGCQHDRVVHAAQRGRDQRRGQAREAGGNAGDDAERDAVFREHQNLLPGAAKHVGVAALQPQHAMPLPRQLDQLRRDVGLLRRRPAAAFAGEHQPGIGTCEVENARADQCVVHQHIGLLDAGQRVQRQQSRIARAGTDEPDVAGPKLRHPPQRRLERSPGHCRHPAK